MQNSARMASLQIARCGGHLRVPSLVSLLVTVATGCGAFDDPPDPSLTIMSLVEPDQSMPSLNIGCTRVRSDGSTNHQRSGSRGDDLWFTRFTHSGGMEVEVGSGFEVLEARDYGRRFISEHRIDRFTVTRRSGLVATFTYWGGDKCETSLPDEIESATP